MVNRRQTAKISTISERGKKNVANDPAEGFPKQVAEVQGGTKTQVSPTMSGRNRSLELDLFKTVNGRLDPKISVRCLSAIVPNEKVKGGTRC